MSNKAGSSRSFNEFEYWGEIPEEREKIPDDLLQTIVLGAVKPENPKIKLPVTENEDEIVTLPPELTLQNDIIRHTIKLNQHAKAVERLMRITNANKNDFRKCPPVPEAVSKKQRLLKYQSSQYAKFYNFSIGQAPPLPQLSNKNIDEMLRKSVIIMLAHAGFDRAGTNTVNTLVDVVKSTMTKLTRLLHHLSQKDICNGSYTDIMEKALRDVGMTGIASLGVYWRKQVVAKREKALNKSCNLFNTYTKLVNKLVTQFAHQSYNQGVQNRAIRSKQQQQQQQGKSRESHKEDLLRSSRMLPSGEQSSSSSSPFAAGSSSSSWQL